MVSKSHSKKTGFTMVELAVTMSIFAVLTSVVLANYRTFSNNADFLNVADSIALSLREAQIYGVGSKGASCGTPLTLNFQCAYGVVFSENDTFYRIFIDTNANSVYDPSDDEILQTVSLPSGSRIAQVSCAPLGNCAGIAILFKRPNPDANIRNIITSDMVNYDSAVITIENAIKTSEISISRAGQISVATRNNTL